MKVLIVEDNELQGKLLCEVMSIAGFEVILAKDGVEALKVLDQYSFDLIVSDVGMPNMDGYTLAKEVQAKMKKSIPFFLYSSRPLDSEELEMAKSYGVAKYINRAGVQGIKDEVMTYLTTKK